MTRFLHISLLALMLFFAAGSTRAEVTGSWDVYPSFNEVTNITVHGDYVWCGTRGGVVRWNRLDGTHHFYRNIPNYIYGTDTTIAVDSRGRAWFGTRGALVCIDGDEITVFTEADGYPAHYVSNISVDQNDNIWIIPSCQQNGALIMFDGSTCQAIDKPDDYIAYNILHPDSSGRIWVNTGKGPAYFHNGVWTVFDGEPYDGGIHAMAENGDGRLFFSTEYGIYTFTDGAFISIYDGYSDADLMAFDSRGNLWLASSRGLARYDGSSITEYPELQPEIYPADIAVDDEDNVWIGSYDNGQQGLVRFDGIDYTRFEPDCLTTVYVWQSTVDATGVLWCATRNGLCSFDGKTWRRHYVPRDPETSVIVQDRNSDLWLGTERGLCRYEGKQWIEIPGTDVLHFNHFNKSLVFDSNNTAWTFMRNNGLWRIDGTSCEQVLSTDSLSSAYRGALAIDHNDVKWIGTNDGVYRYNGRTIWLYQPSGDADFNRVTSIAVDSDNRVWCGGASVFVIEDGVLELRNPPRIHEDAPFCSGVDIAIDPDGRVWAIMSDICAAGELITGGFAVYEDGEWNIVSVPENIHPENDIFAAPDGTIWISNEPGVMRFTPDSGPLSVDRAPQPESISLTNAPNPFNPATTIMFTLPRDGRAMVRVYNVTGQDVATIVDGWCESGPHAVTWDASGCAAGTYFCRVTSGSLSGAVKMTLVK